MRNPKLLLIPLVPALAIGIGLVARALAGDAGPTTTAAPPSVAKEAPPPVTPPAPCPNCGADA